MKHSLFFRYTFGTSFRVVVRILESNGEGLQSWHT